MAMATAMTVCSFSKTVKPLMARRLHEQHGVSELFVTHLLSRNIRYEADLVDQLFNYPQKALGSDSLSACLAQIVGTTGWRVRHLHE
jgi:CRP/FNR family cyclic AMP-dependent transcriptional regulator